MRFVRTSHPSAKRVLFLGFAFAIALMVTLPARAQSNITYVVNSAEDASDATPGDGVCAASGGACTLRAAIEENNAIGNPGPFWGIIELPADTYVLTLGELELTAAVSIEGESPSTTWIDANQDRCFHVSGNTLYNVFLSNFTIYNAFHTTNIFAGTGSGIYVPNPNPAVGMFRVHIQNSGTDWRGGCIFSAGFFSMAESVIQNCSVPRSDGSGVAGDGGGIWSSGNLNIFESLIIGNEGTRGGGIFNVGFMDVVNSTLSRNLATRAGGGVFNAADSASLSYSTVTENEVFVTPDPGRDAPMPVIGGGGIYNAGTLFLAASIVAENVDHRSPFGADYSPDCWSRTEAGTTPIFTSFRSNVVGEVDLEVCNLADSTWGDLRFDIVGAPMNALPPLLSELGNYGGPTPVYALLSGSPALNTNSGGVFDCPEIDQRQILRPIQNQPTSTELCDSGAFELVAQTTALEAEDAELSGLFFIGSDAGASGSEFVSIGNGAGNRNGAPDEAQRIRFVAYVDRPAAYNLIGWVKADAPDDNSFWVRVDGLPAQGQLWDLGDTGGDFEPQLVSDRGGGTENDPDVDPVVFSLSRGMHTIDVYLREDGSQLDKIELVEDGTAQFSLEAESSLLSGAFRVGNDPLASGQQFAFVPPGTGDFLAAPNPAHKVTQEITLDEAGVYLIRANVFAEFDDENSFWVKVDGLPAGGYLWDMTETNVDYGLDYVSSRGGGDSQNPALDPVELSLSAGVHTIEVFAREDGTRLDGLNLELKADADAAIVSQNKPATASSSDSSTRLPPKAVDGNLGTRWASLASDDQWIKLDLLEEHHVHRVVLNWHTAYGKDYLIQSSGDGQTWSTLYDKRGSTGGIDNLIVDGTGRFVRMKGLKRGTSAGYSLFELTVYGTPVDVDEPEGSLSAEFDVASDWGAGYCVDLLVTNNHATAVSDWSVTIDMNGATINSNHWNGNFSATSGVVIIEPAYGWNDTIAAGDTDDSIGFCAFRNNPNSGSLPVVLGTSP